MNNKNLLLPATLIHTVNGKEYTLEGTLISVNESAGLCTMQFGSTISNNIPLSEVYLNEGILDKAKEVGSKIWSKIKGLAKTIGGFLVPVNDKGEKLTEFINLPVNLCAMDLPEGVSFQPSQVTLGIADEYDMRVKNDVDVFAEAEERDCKEIENYWSKVMKHYVANENFTALDAVNYVNETYYHKSEIKQAIFEELSEMDANGELKALCEARGLKYPERNKGTLNEAYIASLYNLVDDMYGPSKSAKELVGIIVSNIKGQVEDDPRRINLREPRKAHPVLVWGAPGIGKSAILNKANKLLAVKPRYRFNIISMQCSQMNKDCFQLPDSANIATGTTGGVNNPQTWIPVYQPAGHTDAELARINDLFNHNIHHIYKTDKTSFTKEEQDDLLARAEYNGGIIFFDELSRMQPGAESQIMALLSDRRFGDGFIMASNWATIAASNRLTDDFKSETDEEFRAKWHGAMSQRFQSYTYVPTKAEWLEWARSANDFGHQHVDERFCRFIEASEPLVWYATIDFGAGSDSGSLQDQLSSIGAIKSATANKAQQGSLDNVKALSNFGQDLEDTGNTIDRNTLKGWSPRTWEEIINKNIEDALFIELFDKDEDMYEACFKTMERGKIDNAGKLHKYTVSNLDDKLIGEQLNKVDEYTWYDWARPSSETVDPRGVMIDNNRLKYFLTWIDKVVIPDALDGKTGKATKMWDNFNKVDMAIPQEQLAEIWKNGELPGKKRQFEDNLTFVNQLSKYIDFTELSKWKASDEMFRNVCDQLIKAYPGNIAKDALKDYKNMENADDYNSITPAQIKKWEDHFSYRLIDADHTKKGNEVLLNGGPINMLFPEGAHVEDNVKKQAVWLLENSKVAEYFANAAFWVGKVCIQTGPTTPMENFTTKITYEFYKNTKGAEYEQYVMNNQKLSAVADIIANNIQEYHIN